MISSENVANPLDTARVKEHYSQADRGGTPFEQDKSLETSHV